MEAPIKRARGRPRKYPRVEDLISQQAAPVQQPEHTVVVQQQSLSIGNRTTSQVELEYQKICAEIGDRLYRRNQYDSEIRELEIKCMALNREYLQLTKNNVGHQ